MFYLGIDEGTTGVTVVLFDKEMRPLARGYAKHTQYYPRPGWVEHDAEEVFESVLSAVSDTLQEAGIEAGQITAIGIDHEGESVVLWDARTGKPVAPAIVWQDTRTAALCESVGQRERIRSCTGLFPNAYFSASKIAWLLAHVPEAKALAESGDLRAGNFDAFLAYRLSGGRIFATDPSTASRTLLMDMQKGVWSEEMAELWKIPLSILPEIRDSFGSFGNTDPEVFFGASVPITALMCDQQAALFGNHCFEEGQMKVTYGTGCFLLMNTGKRPVMSEHGLLPTVAWQRDGVRTYALDGGIYYAGAALQWLSEQAGILADVKKSGSIAAGLDDNGGVYFVPAFGGLAAPYWDTTATGTIIGLTAASASAHIVRAALESCAYQVADVLNAMETDSGIAVTELRCDGGMTGNAFLMQFQADVTQKMVRTYSFPDVTARGIAMAAAVGAGEEAAFARQEEACAYSPVYSAQKAGELQEEWHHALKHARGFKDSGTI